MKVVVTEFISSPFLGGGHLSIFFAVSNCPSLIALTLTHGLVDVDKNAEKFYAVARGRTVGIFESFDDVKAAVTSFMIFLDRLFCFQIAGFPQPMHKKFTDYAEARQYYEKFANGVGK